MDLSKEIKTEMFWMMLLARRLDAEGLSPG